MSIESTADEMHLAAAACIGVLDGLRVNKMLDPRFDAIVAKVLDDYAAAVRAHQEAIALVRAQAAIAQASL